MPVPFSSPRRRRAIIIGGSMSGLFAAAFLRQKGWDADVYERSAVELVGRGAGITTHPELLDALRTSGAGTRDLGVEVEKRIALDRDGRVIAEKYLPQILTSWDRLQRLLRETIDAARYHLGHTFERVEQDGSGVVVHFAGGRSERAPEFLGWPYPDAAVLHADLRLLDPATGVRPRCACRGRCVIRAPAHGLRHGQGRRRHPGARRGPGQP